MANTGPKPKITGIRKQEIIKDVRAGQLSVNAIALKYDVSPSWISKYIQDKGTDRDLGPQVRKKITTRLLKDQAKDPTATDEAIIEAATERGVAIIQSHRADINRLREKEQKLLKELGAGPKKLWVGSYQGKIITKELDLTLVDKAGIFQALTNAAYKRIQLERQAHNIDEDDKRVNDRDRENVVNQVNFNYISVNQTRTIP